MVIPDPSHIVALYHFAAQKLADEKMAAINVAYGRILEERGILAGAAN